MTTRATRVTLAERPVTRIAPAGPQAQARWATRVTSAGARWRGALLLALFAVMIAGAFAPGLRNLALPDGGAPTTHAAALDEGAAGVWLVYHAGYSLQGSWLCYGWPSGSYHCTQRWFRATSGALVSLNPGWVPNGGAAAAVVRGGASATMAFHTANPAPHAVSYPFGQCTFWAAETAHDNVSGLGNALTWAWAARARGMQVTSAPSAGATVVFAPGVQGASWLGHVAHVVRVNANGSFLVSEMNYYGFGGGWGRVSYRTAWPGWGVSFIL